MTDFRRLYSGESEKGILRFSPTDLAKCPIILRDKKEGKHEYKYTEKTKEIFADGNKIHVLRGLYRKGSRELIDTELRMKVIKEDKKYIFSGYADFIMMDENGLYIEDIKSTSRNAFYHFNTEKGSPTEILQVSAYRWLYYIVFGVIINRGVITKIDRVNTLNKFSLEVKLLSINDMERYILKHPTIQVMQGEISEGTFKKETIKFIKENRWICKYCERNEECSINIALHKKELSKKDV